MHTNFFGPLELVIVYTYPGLKKYAFTDVNIHMATIMLCKSTLVLRSILGDVSFDFQQFCVPVFLAFRQE